MNSEYLFVASEIRTLEDLLATISKDKVIERMSLEARLRSAKEILKTLPKHEVAAKAKLIFKGVPILGGHGMAAEFGTRAARAFSDAFAAVVAGLSGPLSPTGPIPKKSKYQLFITGTAVGSFGFEFELPTPSQLQFPELEKPEEAMEKIRTLFKLTAEGSDDELAKIVEEVQPRATKKISEFLNLLVKQEAWCGLEFRGQAFHYKGYWQIQSSCERIKDRNIQEQTEIYSGELWGILPAVRRFEFKIRDKKDPIHGKLDASIEDPDILNRKWLHRPAKIKLHAMRVGEGRPRFTLLSLDDLSPLNGRMNSRPAAARARGAGSGRRGKPQKS